jgi:radical SAM superfamily enzyme YgiQ (UPF0313 family)
MRVGVLEILSLPSRNIANSAFNSVLVKQYASIMPQVVAVWCRRRGHEVYYASYYGTGSVFSRLPVDLDILFISCHTQASPLAYAISRLCRRRGIRSVIGGPHARAFPIDCLRFFDLVVKSCDDAAISCILDNDYPPGTIITANSELNDLPSVEERIREIRASSFYRLRHRGPLTMIPLLASTGCPYSCDFCIDWSTRYQYAGKDLLQADLEYISRHCPGVTVAFHDPNFGVRFNESLEAIESLPSGRRPPYIIESSLTVLREDRLRRLKDTNCVCVAPGVESWSDYSNKASAGRCSGEAQLARMIEQFDRIGEYIPYIQANFIFGLDGDSGDSPVELTKEFMTRTPYVWPVVNLPIPFGDTPMQRRLMEEKRILSQMPFAFYYSPYLVFRLANYTTVEFYEKLIDLLEFLSSADMLRKRVASAPVARVTEVHALRSAAIRGKLIKYRKIIKSLKEDRALRDFHCHGKGRLPQYYEALYDRMLGPYARLLSPADRVPELDVELFSELGLAGESSALWWQGARA